MRWDGKPRYAIIDRQWISKRGVKKKERDKEWRRKTYAVVRHGEKVQGNKDHDRGPPAGPVDDRTQLEKERDFWGVTTRTSGRIGETSGQPRLIEGSNKRTQPKKSLRKGGEFTFLGQKERGVLGHSHQCSVPGGEMGRRCRVHVSVRCSRKKKTMW